MSKYCSKCTDINIRNVNVLHAQHVHYQLACVRVTHELTIVLDLMYISLCFD